ncbi:hypothetical protein CEXT_693291 [Caerostris extrusa]|uniref:Uncharacterized protein n=1 Tax=Caerostris extrusa TaxID=172846 RepID=A0AAV4QB80_CAEEX|nr:hypothetical protein CEXT_693291 [Caerostris extrusa]
MVNKLYGLMVVRNRLPFHPSCQPSQTKCSDFSTEIRIVSLTILWCKWANSRSVTFLRLCSCCCFLSPAILSTRYFPGNTRASRPLREASFPLLSDSPQRKPTQERRVALKAWPWRAWRPRGRLWGKSECRKKWDRTFLQQTMEGEEKIV